MQNQEERLELDQLLQDPEYVNPINLLSDGFTKGSIGSIVAGAIEYEKGTDNTDPKKHPRRYENFRLTINALQGTDCRVGLDPLLGEKGFIGAFRIESQDQPHNHAGIKNGFIEWLTSINKTDNTAGIFEIFNSRGAIYDIVYGEEEKECNELIKQAKNSGYDIDINKKNDGFVFTITERFYLSGDFVNKLNIKKTYLNALDIIFTVKYSQTVVDQPDSTESVPIQNWAVVAQAKFYVEEKENTDWFGKDNNLSLFSPVNISKIRYKILNNQFIDFCKDIKTVHSIDGASAYLVGREKNPKLIFSFSLDDRVDLDNDVVLTKEIIKKMIDEQPYPVIKDYFKKSLMQFDGFNLILNEKSIVASDNKTTIKIILDGDMNNVPGIYIVFREQE